MPASTTDSRGTLTKVATAVRKPVQAKTRHWVRAMGKTSQTGCFGMAANGVNSPAKGAAMDEPQRDQDYRSSHPQADGDS